MGRINKIIEGVFCEIVGDHDSQYDQFIRNNKSNVTTDYLNEYQDIIKKNESIFNSLAKLEEIILQLRSRENLDDFKLSLIREYIYARCPFYRKDIIHKDVRVIVGKVDEFGSDLDSLMSNPEFRNKAKMELTKTMNDHIHKNIIQYQKDFGELTICG